MPSYVYVAAQDDNKILIFQMDEGTGQLTAAGETAVSGGPVAACDQSQPAGPVRRSSRGARTIQLQH